MKSFRLTAVRECRVLTPIGWTALLTVFGVILFVFIIRIYPFLAPTKPVNGEILLVEGWLPDYALEKVKNRFFKNDYKLIVTTGGGFTTDHPLAQYKTLANWTALRLRERGISLEQIIPVTTMTIHKKDRTYQKALTVKKKLIDMGINQESIDIMSLGPHSRRTWLIFKKVFSSVEVGIVALEPKSYERTRWWIYSAGVRNVISEAIAYLYVKIIFRSSIPADAKI